MRALRDMVGTGGPPRGGGCTKLPSGWLRPYEEVSLEKMERNLGESRW